MVKMEPREAEVTIGSHQQSNIRLSEAYGEGSQAYSLADFRRKLRMSVVKCTDEDLEFDIIGVDPAIANAIRRILIAEVPTMAADRITLINNTSFIHDKDLTNRIGLVPIRVDSRLFENRNPEQPASSQDTVVFELHIRCTKNLQAAQDSTLPKDIYSNSSVYSGHLTWVPLEGQEMLFAKNPPKPIHDDILIAKLRPGQEIDMKIEYLKGIGKTHAKFSPVATASYRLLPVIEILEDVCGEAARRLKNSFSKGVVEIEKRNGVDVAKIVNPRMDTCSRNVLMHDDLAEKVRLGRKLDHFIFSVESVGMLPSDILVKESIKVMLGKCKSFLDQIERVRGKRKNANGHH
ncbi:DNA-directed RNA polymerases I and III subunit RPAC1 [Galendromus occidentalis]|uniref:DNA-directed RNA polymerases I and III subunit RPAC1 n=1 Tax=Galendromus occidentalis TaxID=34638 RepID=A0AAJ7WI71_9ACAR|nr:DNA-directed RNA polymerases I and III subunit RPAC1 [Galendromus occidentalis]